MNESYKKGLKGFDPATSCILRQCSTTWAILAVTNYHFLNVIDEQVKVYSAGKNL